MKKFVLIMLVLGLAGVASANVPNSTAMVQISIDGEYPDQIVLQPSDTVIIDINCTLPTLGFAFDLEIIGAGHIDDMNSVPWIHPEVLDWSFTTDMLIYDRTGIQQFAAGGFAALGDVVVEGVILDGLIFHCDGPQDVILRLTMLDALLMPDGITPYLGVTLGEVHIIQPEPATLALLGLGGLFLRRRK